MIEKLCELVQRNQNLLNLVITYTKVSDWDVAVYQRISAGEEDLIVGSQSLDLTTACAKVYLQTTEWLSNYNRGY